MSIPPARFRRKELGARCSALGYLLPGTLTRAATGKTSRARTPDEHEEDGMVSLRAASAIAFACTLAGVAHADQPLMQAGSYEITFRLELPHLENWAIEKTTRTCVSETRGEGNTILPILSDNNPFAGCSAKNVHRDEDSLTYEIVCNGRDSAKAQATYTLRPGGFMGRIAIRMGAKNMTMTEVQTGRRVASCDREIATQER
jgi:hypothetical protein